MEAWSKLGQRALAIGLIIVIAGGVASGAPGATLVIHRTGHEVHEPTLGITAQGEVVVGGTSFVAGLPVPTLFASRDGGATWVDANPTQGPARTHPYTEDPYIYLDEATGRLFAADLLLPCGEVSTSDDGGRTWSAASVVGCELADHETIFAGPPATSATLGYPRVTYYCAIAAGLAAESFASACDKSLDGGVTWLPTGAPALVTDATRVGDYDVQGWCSGSLGHGAVGPDGTIYLPKGWCGQPWVAISHDEGATWTHAQIAGNGMPRHRDGLWGHDVDVAVDAAGNVYAMWIGGDFQPYLATSRDGGASWSAPVAVAPPGVTEAAQPAMAVGAPGRLALLYMASTNAPGVPQAYDSRHCAPVLNCDSQDASYANATWTGYLAIVPDALEEPEGVATFPITGPDHPLVKGACGPVWCQAEYDFISVEIAPDGTAWAALADGCVVPCPGSPAGSEGIVAHLVGGPRLR